MTAQESYELSLALLDEVDESGDIDEADTASYAGKAPMLITILQRELAKLEGIQLTGRIESLSDTLEISDETAEKVLPYGLAAGFALADNNEEFYKGYTFQYEKLKKTITSDEEEIHDNYHILDGMS